MTNLSSWQPKLLLNDVADLSGQTVSVEQWNNLWLLHRTQGDDTANTLQALLLELFSTIWSPTNGALHIVSPAVYPAGSSNVAGQLAELKDHLDDAETKLDLLEDLLAAVQAGTIGAFNHNDISNRNAADAHSIAAISGLQAALDAGHAVADIEYSTGVPLSTKLNNMDAVISGLSSGVVSISHADVLGRDAADAHPIAAITGLQAALDAKASATALTNYQTKITASTTNPSGGSDGDVWIVYA